MAVTIKQKPQYDPTSAYGRLPYYISGSTNLSEPQHQYVMDVYLSGSTDLIKRTTCVNGPNNVVVFDPAKIFQGELDYDNYWKVTGIATASLAKKDFEVKFGEQYASSTSGSVTVYPNITSDVITVYAGTLQQSSPIFWTRYEQALNQNVNSNDTIAENYVPDGNNQYYYSQILGYNDYHTLNVNGPSEVRIDLVNNSGSVLATQVGNVLEDFSTVGVGPQNLKDQYASIGQLLYDSQSIADLSHIDVYVSSSTQQTTQSLFLPDSTFQVNSEEVQQLINEQVRFAWINSYGTWDYYNVYNPVRQVSNYDRKSFTYPKLDYSATSRPSANEQYEKRGLYDINIDKSDVFEVTTQYVDDDLSQYLANMFNSPSVFIQKGFEFIPIVLDNTQFQHAFVKRDKILNYTIRFIASNEPYGNWIKQYVCPPESVKSALSGSTTVHGLFMDRVDGTPLMNPPSGITPERYKGTELQAQYGPYEIPFIFNIDHFPGFASNTDCQDAPVSQSLRWRGQFKPPVDDTYEFTIDFVSGSGTAGLQGAAAALFIGDGAYNPTQSNAIVRNDSYDGEDPESGSVYLSASTYYPFQLQYSYGGYDGSSMKVTISSSTVTETEDFNQYLYYDSTLDNRQFAQGLYGREYDVYWEDYTCLDEPEYSLPWSIHGSQSGSATPPSWPVVTDLGAVNEINYTSSRAGGYSMEWLGYFTPPTSDTYTFYLQSTSGSALWIGQDTALANYKIGYSGDPAANNAVVNKASISNEFPSGVNIGSGSIYLSGSVRYPMRVIYGQHPSSSNQQMIMSYSSSTQTQTTDFTGLFSYNTNYNNF